MQEAMGYIYKITCNINGKVYIGQTTQNISRRWQEHIWDAYNTGLDRSNTKFCRAIRKYSPENFSVEEIEKIPYSFLNKREIYWIDYYNSYDKGYNSTLGGENGRRYNYEDLANDYLQTKSIEITANNYNCDLGTVEAACFSCGISPSEHYLERVRKPIYALNEQGKILLSFNSITEAKNYLLDNNITKSEWASRAIKDALSQERKRTNYAYGYYWCLQKDYYLGYKNKIIKRTKSVCQLDKDTNELIKIFNSVTEASKEIGISRRLIGMVCNHEPSHYTAGGYKWMFLEEYEELVEENEINLTTNEK